MILLVTPPLTQLNSSYPATSVLVGYLRSEGVDARQLDLSILTMLRVLREQHDPLLDAVVRFLQGRDRTLQNRFALLDTWPEDMTADLSDDDLYCDYGESGLYDRAQYLATLYLERCVADIRRRYSRHFEAVRYAEHLCSSLSDFDPLLAELNREPNGIDRLMLDELEQYLHAQCPIGEMEDVLVGISVPFPGNLYAGLRVAQYIKGTYPHARIAMGGGYVTTELRSLSDARIFGYVDTLLYDDGELPLLQLCRGQQPVHAITCEDGQLVRHGWDSADHVRFAEIGAPCLDGIDLSLYMDTADTANPMARLWSNGRWLKLQMARGCYWHGCTFCDTTLDYIRRYESAPASVIVDRMESLMAQSGLSGFHFVDEAAPPKLMREVAEEILRRGLVVTWWTNIRFERTYDASLCRLLARSGCVAVSGGIEVASERLLRLINKGVSLPGLRTTLTAFRDAGIMVHAYLMYGFVTQTEQELMESLANVRDFFADGLISSAFWHRYAMTCHAQYRKLLQQCPGVVADDRPNSFATNEIPFREPNAPDWSRYTKGLNTATYNYMRGVGYDIPIKKWFK